MFRRELRLDPVVQALADLEHDVDAGVWKPPAYDLEDVHTRAEHLARRHAATLGTRNLDILHVAAALALGATCFITGDRRQALLAKAAGLDATLRHGAETHASHLIGSCCESHAARATLTREDLTR